MKTLPSRFRRLDDALADLPVEGDGAMLLSELDGFLTGIALCPDPIDVAEWLPFVWRAEAGGGPFADPVDARMFAAMVAARHDEIVRELARGKPQPIFDIDGRHGETLWEPWIEGFETAMALRPATWSALADGDGPDGDGANANGADVADALADLTMLIEVAFDESDLTSDEINRICDAAPALIPARLSILQDGRMRRAGTPATAPASTAKVGRNDPCPCGSGRKSKRCCAAA